MAYEDSAGGHKREIHPLQSCRVQPESGGRPFGGAGGDRGIHDQSEYRPYLTGHIQEAAGRGCFFLLYLEPPDGGGTDPGASGGAAGRPAVGRRPGSHLGCGRVSGSVPGDVGNHAGRRGRNLLPAGDILYRRRGFALRDPGTDLPGRGRADP